MGGGEGYTVLTLTGIFYMPIRHMPVNRPPFCIAGLFITGCPLFTTVHPVTLFLLFKIFQQNWQIYKLHRKFKKKKKKSVLELPRFVQSHTQCPLPVFSRWPLALMRRRTPVTFICECPPGHFRTWWWYNQCSHLSEEVGRAEFNVATPIYATVAYSER